MLKVALRNLLDRKIRMVMSAFAIVLGVAFVAGSLVFTDAMGNGFNSIIAGGVADVEVSYPNATNFDSMQDNRTIDASVADAIAKAPGVGSVHPNLQQQSLFVVSKDGDLLASFGPPGLAFNDTGTTNINGDKILTVSRGRMPKAAGEVALLTDTANDGHYEIGDTVTMVTPGNPPSLTATLVGTVDFSNGGVLGATIVIFDTTWMQQLFYDGADVFDSISVDAANGVSQTQLRRAVAAVVPPELEARTGDRVAKENKDAIDNAFLKYIRIFMLVFAGIALVVGAFLIVNTFSILVAQRTRELALLRALGASRRQVVGAVLMEALIVGLIGSTLGLLLGFLLARGIAALLENTGLELGSATFELKPATIVWSYALGIIVTVIAALLPALRGSRVAPVAALRDDVALPEATMRGRLLAGVGMVVLGIVSVVLGFAGEGGRGVAFIGIGLLLVMLGVALCGPMLALPFVAAFGALYRRLFTRVGQLAAENAGRNPRRTAATASALMIGITLVTMVSIFGRSASASTEKALETSLKADVVVTSVAGQPFSPDIAAEIRQVPGVASVASVRQAVAKRDGDDTFVAGLKSADIAAAEKFDMVAGSIHDLEPGDVVVQKKTAESAHLAVGDSVDLEFQGGTASLDVVGVYDTAASVQAPYLVDQQTLADNGLKPLDARLMVVFGQGADPATTTDAIQKLTADISLVSVQDPNQYIEDQKKQINGFLALVYSLLALSVVIAVLGVINTLGLSVIERTREVGLLRAVGLSRRQLRTMLRLESVIIAVLGAVLGIVLGCAFGVSLVMALEDQGITELSIPWMLLLWFVVAAGVVGVLAAVWPGRRAARLDVLKAIAAE